MHIHGAPDYELERSPAARVIGEAAAESGLFLAHFEYRVPLEVPEHWLPPDRPDLGVLEPWRSGVLPESKYTSFRNDLMIGSFHPGHRAKWTAHELCHGLVGFAWSPDATPFFHALAARMSELLPVALFYFFDEIGLNRCPDHRGGGPLFGVTCQACERAAREPDRADHRGDDRFAREGLAFVTRELEAIARSREAARMIASPWANIDLASDGLAYAAAQSRRLASPEFHRYIELFFPPDHGHHTDLEALEARIGEVLATILDGNPLDPWLGSRDHWIAADVGWRLLEISAQTDSEIADHLTHALEDYAGSANQHGLQRLIERYRALHETHVLPDPEDVFAVGYPLPAGFGLSNRQISDGIASACPATWEALGGMGEERRTALVQSFTARDRPDRKPLGIRFATFLRETEPGPAARMAEVEAGITHAPAADAMTRSLGSSYGTDDRVALDPAVRVIHTEAAVAGLLGLASGDETAGRLAWLALRREPDGEVVVLNLSDDLGRALELLTKGPKPRGELALEESSLRILEEAHLISPVAWHETRSPGR